MTAQRVARVMIIEDDEWLALHYRRILEASGYEVAWAANALDGIEALDDTVPDVILLDLFMPGPNGIALLHEIRSYQDLRRIPVILCTNSAAELDATHLRQYGVVTLLDKTTMTPKELLASVRSLVVV